MKYEHYRSMAWACRITQAIKDHLSNRMYRCTVEDPNKPWGKSITANAVANETSVKLETTRRQGQTISAVIENMLNRRDHIDIEQLLLTRHAHL